MMTFDSSAEIMLDPFLNVQATSIGMTVEDLSFLNAIMPPIGMIGGLIMSKFRHTYSISNTDSPNTLCHFRRFWGQVWLQTSNVHSNLSSRNIHSLI